MLIYYYSFILLLQLFTCIIYRKKPLFIKVFRANRPANKANNFSQIKQKGGPEASASDHLVRRFVRVLFFNYG